MQLKISAAAAVALTTILLLPAAAQATCKEGICAEGHEEGDSLIVQFSTTNKNVTKYNFNAGSGQRELGIHETQVTIPMGSDRPVTIHYAFQTCGPAIPVVGSACTPWANFSHTAAAKTQGGGGGGGPLYVAVAGDEKGRFELSTGYPNAQSATAAALNGCGAGCKLLFEHQAKCVALSSVPEGKPWAVASGDDLGRAQITAQQDCSKQAPGRCKGVQARCAP